MAHRIFCGLILAFLGFVGAYFFYGFANILALIVVAIICFVGGAALAGHKTPRTFWP